MKRTASPCTWEAVTRGGWPLWGPFGARLVHGQGAEGPE